MGADGIPRLLFVLSPGDWHAYGSLIHCAAATVLSMAAMVLCVVCIAGPGIAARLTASCLGALALVLLVLLIYEIRSVLVRGGDAWHELCYGNVFCGAYSVTRIAILNGMGAALPCTSAPSVASAFLISAGVWGAVFALLHQLHPLYGLAALTWVLAYGLSVLLSVAGFGLLICTWRTAGSGDTD